MALLATLSLLVASLLGASAASASDELIQAEPPTFVQATIDQQYGTLIIPDDPVADYKYYKSDYGWVYLDPGEYQFPPGTGLTVDAYADGHYDGVGMAEPWTWSFAVDSIPEPQLLVVRRAGPGRVVFRNPNWQPVELSYGRDYNYSHEMVTVSPGESFFFRTKWPTVNYSSSALHDGVWRDTGSRLVRVRNPQGSIRVRTGKAAYILRNQLPWQVRYVLKMGNRRRVVSVGPGARRRVVWRSQSVQRVTLRCRGVLLDDKMVWP